MSRLTKGTLDWEIARTLLETELFYKQEYFVNHLDDLTGDKCKELLLKGNSWLNIFRAIEDRINGMQKEYENIPPEFGTSAYTVGLWKSVDWDSISDKCHMALIDHNYDI
jgi:hypothetical protein